MYIGSKYKMSSGVGKSKNRLTSFDHALIEAGVGNYNLVRLSSILPAKSKEERVVGLKEGSLLPIAYSTISSGNKGDELVSTIGVGFPKDESKVGVIMEYSVLNKTVDEAFETLDSMIKEAFEIRGWELASIQKTYAYAKVYDERVYTTFACIAEW